MPLIHKALAFRDLKRAHDFDLRAAAKAAVKKFPDRPTDALASAGFWFHLDESVVVDVAHEAGINPAAVQREYRRIMNEFSDHEEELAGIRRIAHKL